MSKGVQSLSRGVHVGMSNLARLGQPILVLGHDVCLRYTKMSRHDDGCARRGWLAHTDRWSSPVEWCNRFVSFGVGYALSWSGGSSCPVGWGVSRDLVRMSRLR